MSTNTNDTALRANPFFVLGVTTRDNRRKIVEVAEERSLHLDSDVCQQARSDLTNLRTRLSAEMGWMPGVAPGIADKLVKALSSNPSAAWSDVGLSSLARANMMAAACELVAENESVSSVTGFICKFVDVVESIDPNDVLRDVNEDRNVAGFPEIQGVELVEEELQERRKTYRFALKNLLDGMEPTKLIGTMTAVARRAIDENGQHVPVLLDDLVNSYEIEAQGFLQKEAENISVLIRNVRSAAPRGSQVVDPLLDRLDKIARNWHGVALPILVCARSRGIVHEPSELVAIELRSLAIDLTNKHDLLDQSDRMTRLLRELFAELPEVAERLGEDAEAINKLSRQANERKRNDQQWERDITFRGEVGVVFKDELAISPQGIHWKGRSLPLESIARVRWGGVRRSVNGIPTGTDYTIAIGDNHSTQVVALRKEATYSGFIKALWSAVCVRLMIEMLSELEKGKSLSFGDFVVEDDGVILVQHKFFEANRKARLGWHEVNVWTSDGKFVIGKKDDKKTYGSASYIHTWNAHLVEHVIRGALRKGSKTLSGYLKD